MIPGIKISMGGSDYEVPPLTLGQLKRLQPIIARLGSQDQNEIFDAISEIVQVALSRNYPSISKEQVEDLLDLANCADTVAAVLRGSGLKLGEAMAVARTPGPASMDSSPPPADTAIQ
jgi:hypothetical protein